MKLIICSECDDIVNLEYHWKACQCGKSCGRYLEDGDHAEIAGFAVPFGIGGGYFKIAYQEKAIFFGWFYGDLVPDHGKITTVPMPRTFRNRMEE